ncbi:RNA polymerase sigma factor [Chitinophaga agri]|uniref:RNA polymerase sigma factor n=1 Tax=Chitinophaga agri TaxID=2703787 RepID=A0A6B9Z9Y0_9BACT|nr:RNA polymerase sigma factor [Chitinophaga agri]QHS58887.1 RNA polymerase sigma factor [Chitinophaga agri]
MEHIEDDLLLLELREGSESALNTFYKRYSKDVYLHAYRRLQNADDAKDVQQDVFVTIWRKRSDLEDIRNFRNFFVKVAINLAQNKLEKKHTDIIREKKYMMGGPFMEDPRHEDSSKMDELLVAIDTHLPPIRAAAMKKVYFDREKQQKVASEFGITVPILRGWIVSSIKILREKFKK